MTLIFAKAPKESNLRDSKSILIMFIKTTYLNIKKASGFYRNKNSESPMSGTLNTSFML